MFHGLRTFIYTVAYAAFFLEAARTINNEANEVSSPTLLLVVISCPLTDFNDIKTIFSKSFPHVYTNCG